MDSETSASEYGYQAKFPRSLKWGAKVPEKEKLVVGKMYTVRIKDPREYLEIHLKPGTEFVTKSGICFTPQMWGFVGKELTLKWIGDRFQGGFCWLPEWVELLEGYPKLEIENPWFEPSDNYVYGKMVLCQRKKPTNEAEAFEMSLNKWLLLSCYPGEIQERADNCGLCVLYSKDDPYKPICSSCPIYQETKGDNCSATPYCYYTKNETRENAEAELQFLLKLTKKKYDVKFISQYPSSTGYYKVKEKEEKIDWSKVPVDTKILVKDVPSGIFNRRYFAYFKDGNVFAYVGGMTSWSAGTKEQVCDWLIAKLFKEEIEKC